jgi:hypothetical protein
MSIADGELANRMNAEADRRGLSPIGLLEELSVQSSLLDDSVRDPRPATYRDIAFAAIGSSSGEVRARDLDDLLAEGFGRP